MHRIIVSLLSMCLFAQLFAQDVSEFHLNFFVLETSEDDMNFSAKVRSNIDFVDFDESSTGQLISVYDSEKKTGPSEVGLATYVGLEEGSKIFELQIPKSNPALSIRDLGKIIIKIPATSTSKANESLVYAMHRYGITMISIYENTLLMDVPSFDLSGATADEVFIPDLLDDIILTADLMRQQMESPQVTKGKFSGMDLFSAMEQSNFWDVYSFLNYINEHPSKYLGQTWKISEIYATWVDAGTPGSMPMTNIELKENLREIFGRDFSAGVPNNFKLRFLTGVHPQVLKDLCSDYRKDIDQSLKDGSNPYGSLHAAQKIARFLEDRNELGACAFKAAQINMDEEFYDLAIDKFKESITYYEVAENVAGKIVANNELGQAYNALKTTNGYKNAIKHLETALELSSSFKKDNKATAPISAFIYTNLGDSYVGLSKDKKALELYMTGLEYTDVDGAHALKRKAILELSISEVYRRMNQIKLADDYEARSTYSYLAYEQELEQETRQ